jgi:hypothetical protein
MAYRSSGFLAVAESFGVWRLDAVVALGIAGERAARSRRRAIGPARVRRAAARGWVGLPTWALPGRAGPAAWALPGGQGQAGQVGAAPGAGLIPDPVQVGADGADADVQLGGDLRVGAALGDQLPFPGAESPGPGAADWAGPGAVSSRAYSAAVSGLIPAPGC